MEIKKVGDNEIRFMATFGDQQKKVDISRPNGMGDEIYTVHVDRYCYGDIKKRNGKWVGLNTPGLETADIQIIGELIDQYLAG
jgi:hypothetical protein